MALVTLTTKGRFTIPKKIRDLLRLHTGDKIELVATESREAIIRPISKKIDDVFCKLHKTGRKAVSTEAMNSIIKKG